MKINFSVVNSKDYDFGIRNVDKIGHSCGFEKINGYKNKPTNNISFGGFNVSFLQNLLKKAAPYLNPDRKGFDLAESLAANTPKWAKKIAEKKGFQNVLNKTRDNPAVVQALVELGVVGVIRSLIVIVTPGVKKGDKETSISKNIVSAITGYSLSYLVFKPIGSATKKLLKEPGKYIRNEKILSKLNGVNMKGTEAANYKTALHNFFNKGPDILMAPLKSALTVALIPVVMGILFKDNPKAKSLKHNGNQPDNNLISNDAISNIIIDKNIKEALSSMRQKGAQQ